MVAKTNELLEEILKTAANLPVKYYEYESINPEYIVYNEEAEQPVDYGDNHPQSDVIWWQVHIFAPRSSDFRGIKNKVKEALQKNDFTVTDIVTLYEKETKTIHVVISCHAEEGEE